MVCGRRRRSRRMNSYRRKLVSHSDGRDRSQALDSHEFPAHAYDGWKKREVVPVVSGCSFSPTTPGGVFSRRRVTDTEYDEEGGGVSVLEEVRV
jgi:hypothetical protein